jgi:hypothetical protein
MKHKVVTTHTFTGDKGVKITIEREGEKVVGVAVQFAHPGSGNAPRQLSIPELHELAELAAEAAGYLNPKPISDLPAGIVNYGQPG